MSTEELEAFAGACARVDLYGMRDGNVEAVCDCDRAWQVGSDPMTTLLDLIVAVVEHVPDCPVAAKERDV